VTSSSQAFWEDRLAADWSLSGVGYAGLGRAFNTWMYRVRREVFLREARRLPVDLATCDVLDVGSGTGFYIDLWRQLGVRRVTGCDLTSAAVDRLRNRFPDSQLHQVDISQPDPPLPPGSFDLVSCMDVLFHITDDAAYATALRNLGHLVRPGGWVLLSENFLHGAELRGPHQVNRRLDRILALLDDAGLDIVHRTAMFVLMNGHVDAGRARRIAWAAVLRALTVLPGSGRVSGALLFPLERRLVRSRREGPSTELAICRRRDEPTSV
jgi:SAM-dependent methyltransferase